MKAQDPRLRVVLHCPYICELVADRVSLRAKGASDLLMQVTWAGSEPGAERIRANGGFTRLIGVWPPTAVQPPSKSRPGEDPPGEPRTVTEFSREASHRPVSCDPTVWNRRGTVFTASSCSH